MAVEALELEEHPLWEAAVDVLAQNDLGTSTKAAGDLYPHQWSWDSAFVAIGLARVDPNRAAVELRSLLDAQWSNGKIPHIVFNPETSSSSYWPGAKHWACEAPSSAQGSCRPDTSGLCQPPVHAIAALRIWRTAREHGRVGLEGARQFLAEAYPHLFLWHRYLHTARDPEASGLITIYHPWESGMDNSPRWDEPLARLQLTRPHDFERADLARVTDPSQRPSDSEYACYAWLIDLLREHCYEDAEVYRVHPFLVKDVFASALLVAANRALLEIAQIVGAPATDQSTIRRWWERGRLGLSRSWSPQIGLSVDRDLRTGTALQTHTIAGLAPLIAGTARGRRRRLLIRALESRSFLGAAELRWPLPPSTSPSAREFDSRAYWRGPVWPVTNWLLWWALGQLGRGDLASRIRNAALDQISATGVMPEYIEPFTGEALGAPDQSWTAAVVLDWLATPSESTAPLPSPVRRRHHRSPRSHLRLVETRSEVVQP